MQDQGIKREEVYEVRKIIGKRLRADGVVEYHVEWVHYGDWTTWEPEGNLEGARDAIFPQPRRPPLDAAFAQRVFGARLGVAALLLFTEPGRNARTNQLSRPVGPRVPSKRQLGQ